MYNLAGVSSFVYFVTELPAIFGGSIYVFGNVENPIKFSKTCFSWYFPDPNATKWSVKNVGNIINN